MKIPARWWKRCSAAIMALVLVGASADSVTAAPKLTAAQQQTIRKYQELKNRLQQLNSQAAQLQRRRLNQKDQQRLQEMMRLITTLNREMLSTRNSLPAGYR